VQHARQQAAPPGAASLALSLCGIEDLQPHLITTDPLHADLGAILQTEAFSWFKK